MMNRRAFLTAVGAGILVAPLAANANQAGKVYRIGILSHSFAGSDLVGPQPRSPYAAALLGGAAAAVRLADPPRPVNPGSSGRRGDCHPVGGAAVRARGARKT